jgi:hypothetical protein
MTGLELGFGIWAAIGTAAGIVGTVFGVLQYRDARRSKAAARAADDARQRMADELAAVRQALADQGKQAQYALEEERRANRQVETEARRSRMDSRRGEHRQRQHDQAMLNVAKKQGREQGRHNRKTLEELKRQAREARRRR